MADIIPRHIIISFMIFTMVFGVGIYILADFNQNQPDYMSPDELVKYNSTFNKYAEYQNTVTGLKSNIENNQPSNLLSFGVVGAIINTVWTGLTNMFTTFGFMLDTITSIPAMINLPFPDVVTGLLVTIILTIFLFTLYSFVTNQHV